ncbi:hypothetical protein FXB40_24525 [Bradyrhizobium rifense]|uniref:Uncharacterized protein n=1 Tax=Bradyrhizobium rifense TaxID=515499 RepID=A0A5D3KGL1_9BRAD|nr:hypothetical protein [Bradyrhizobium rifense]TYL92608.1 hypothetical protein FXB40_24525 [Bradyrhizobium rifense]
MTHINCPKCDSLISDKAQVCPVCHANLVKPTRLSRLLGLRDYLTLPAALTALVVSLAGWVNDFRPVLKLDDAKVTGYLLNPDIINVGLDDRPTEQQVKKVTEYIQIQRVILFNNGYSLASVQSSFVCTGDETGPSRHLFTFVTYDTKQRIKTFVEIKPSETVVLSGKLSDANLYTKEERASAGPNTCTFGYYDKFGLKGTVIAIKPAQMRPFLETPSAPADDASAQAPKAKSP